MDDKDGLVITTLKITARTARRLTLEITDCISIDHVKIDGDSAWVYGTNDANEDAKWFVTTVEGAKIITGLAH